MPVRVNANRDDTARPAGSAAWLASAAIGPRIAFAADDGTGAGAGAGAGSGTGDAAGKGAAGTGGDNGGAGDGGNKGGDAGAGDGAAGKGDQKPARPEGLSDDFWDKDKGEVKLKELTGRLSELTAFKAQADSRAAQVPEAADKYEAKLPEGFKLPDTVKLPEGKTPEIDADDPRLAMAKEFAHKRGLTQGEFEELVAMGVNADLAQMSQLQAAQAEQIKAMGSRGAERVAAAKTWLEAQLGADLGKSLTRVLFSEKQFQAVEKLMSLYRHDSPGRPGAGRDGGKVEMSDEEYDKLSPTDKINYARNASKK